MSGFENPGAGLLPWYLALAVQLAFFGDSLLQGRRRTAKVLPPYYFFQAALTAAFLLGLPARGTEGAGSWSAIETALVAALSASALLFARQACGLAYRRPLLASTLLYLPTVLSLVLAGSLAAPSGIGARLANPAWDLLGFEVSILELLLCFYSFALGLFSLGLLFRAALGGAVAERKRFFFLFAGLAFPLVAFIFELGGLGLLGRHSLAPPVFAFGDLCIALALAGDRFLDLVPLVRHTVVRSLGDPVVAIDPEGLVLDCNPAFADLASSRPGKLRGLSLDRALRGWPAESVELLRKGRELARLRLGEGEGERVFTLYPSLFSDPRGRPGGRAVVLRDVTGLEAAERSLRGWNAVLIDQVRERTSALEAEVERRRAAEDELRLANEGLHGSQREIMITLSEVVESRSRETARHVFRVGEYTRILAAARGLSPEHVSLLADAAPMHDVGKISVPDAILNKAGTLTPEETVLMRAHTTTGYELLSKSARALIRAAAVIALEHHERWDGRGYPAGKVGTEISLSGRIVAICDVFDALSTRRSYKDAWDFPRVLDHFREERGVRFDPALVDLLFLHFDRFAEIATIFPDEEGGRDPVVLDGEAALQ